MRTVSRALISATLVTALSLGVAACSSGGGSGSGSAHLTTVNFGYIADYNGSSLLAIADKQGLWAKAGLKPSLKVFTNGPLQITALGAGDLDFGYIGPGALWLPASGKAKVVAIDTLTTADRVIAQPGITSMQGLKGKKVGVPEGTSGEMVLNLALQKAGMTSKDIQEVPMDPATIVSAFLSGRIAGAGIWYPLLSSIQAKKSNLVEVASDTDFTATDAFPTAFVSGEKTSPALTAKVLQVLAEANDYRAAHPQQAIADSASLLKVSLAAAKLDAQNVTVFTTAQLVAKGQDGTIDNWLNGLDKFFVQTKQLTSVPAPSSFYDSTLYAQAASAATAASASSASSATNGAGQ